MKNRVVPIILCVFLLCVFALLGTGCTSKDTTTNISNQVIPAKIINVDNNVISASLIIDDAQNDKTDNKVDLSKQIPEVNNYTLSQIDNSGDSDPIVEISALHPVSFKKNEKVLIYFGNDKTINNIVKENSQ